MRAAIGVAAALAAAAACGGAGPAAPGAPGAPVAEPGAWAAGSWTWRHTSESASARVVEIEDWSLRASGGALAGWYQREVIVTSRDGSPFSCNQAASYRLRTRYQVRGRAAGDTAWLDEVAFRTEPSPCERGARATARYRLRRRGAGLELTFPGGRQLLARRPSPPARWPAAAGALGGSWQWRSRRVTPRGEVRTEIERWYLDEADGGAVVGVYRRELILEADGGGALPCSGQPRTSIVDHYLVRGFRDGDQLVLDEVAALPDRGACAGERRRHLDQASGAIYPEHVVLIWRGRNRQVLRRPGAQSSGASGAYSMR